MARHEADREDLFAQAVAYKQAAELADSAFGQPLFLGYRADGRFGIYIGGDLAYQFTADLKLRRAFKDHLIYQSTGTTLCQLQRVRTPDETTLQRVDLDEVQLQQFRTHMLQVVAKVQQCVTQAASTDWRVRGESNTLLAGIERSVVEIVQRNNSANWLSPALR